jgi:DNA-binding NarL/FixJ family response regulator
MESILEARGAVLDPSDRVDLDRNLAAARAQLDEAAWAKAWAEGRAMSLEEAIALALEPMPERPPAEPAAGEYPNELSKREVEVLRVVAEGLTDAQVAERLCVSVRTVENHLRSIYSKLGVSTRAAATRFPVEHRLV